MQSFVKSKFQSMMRIEINWNLRFTLQNFHTCLPALSIFHSVIYLSAIDFDVYQLRHPKASAYYRCVEDHFEQLETVWDERYQSRFGFWRSYVTDVIQRYLNCGDLHFGFARVKCEDCGHEYLLAFLCKRRHFCPSCHQKRVVEFGEWLCTEVLKYVPHRQWVFR